MTRTRLLLLALLASLALSACNTISGIGQDVRKAGEVITDTAEDCKGGCDD